MVAAKAEIANVSTEIAAFRSRLGTLADALTNSCMQAIQSELKRQGVKGGLRDSRKLREELIATIKRDLVEDILDT